MRQAVPLISHMHSYSPYCSQLHPPFLFLFHNFTIIAEHKVKSSHQNSPCHVQEWTLSTAYPEYSIHWVRHTLSTAYTEYNIHQVQFTLGTASTEFSIHLVHLSPSTAYTEYSIHQGQHQPIIIGVLFILMIMWWLLNVALASGIPPNTSTATSLLTTAAPMQWHLVTFPQLWVDHPMNRVSSPGAPSFDWRYIRHFHVHLQTC